MMPRPMAAIANSRGQTANALQASSQTNQPLVGVFVPKVPDPLQCSAPLKELLQQLPHPGLLRVFPRDGVEFVAMYKKSLVLLWDHHRS
jgi:hypothetical protein